MDSQTGRKDTSNMTFMVDRMDSELKHMFIIRSNNYHCCAIAFDSVSSFVEWING